MAFVGAPGIAVHVGDNLVDFSAGRDTIASVTAHEIGHNLGLSHVSGNNNLLSEGGNSTTLTDGQISTIFRSSLSQPVTSANSVTTIEGADDEYMRQTISLTAGDAQSDSATTIGGCGGCGVCAACTGGLTS